MRAGRPRARPRVRGGRFHGGARARPGREAVGVEVARGGARAGARPAPRARLPAGADRRSAAARGRLVRPGLGERGDRARRRHRAVAVGGQAGARARRPAARDDALARPAAGGAGRGRAVLGAARRSPASVHEGLAAAPCSTSSGSARFGCGRSRDRRCSGGCCWRARCAETRLWTAARPRAAPAADLLADRGRAAIELLGGLELGQREDRPGAAGGRMRRAAARSRGSRAGAMAGLDELLARGGRIAARGVDRRQLPQRIDRDRVAGGGALGVGERGCRVCRWHRRDRGVELVGRVQRLPHEPGRDERGRDDAESRRPRRPGRSSGAGAAGARPTGSASGPRPASQPAHTSAGTVTPGMNQVQSISEETPKVTTTASIVMRPIRSAACADAWACAW